MARRLRPLLFVPAWLLVMLCIAAGGLYLGYRRPDVALAVVVLFFVGVWFFWWSWHDLVRDGRP